MNGETATGRRPGRFAWYELMTTDVTTARAFYSNVVGWSAQDASTTELPYTLFTAGNVPISGLIALPEEATQMGATPRWMGYVSVDNANATSERIKHLGGVILFRRPTAISAAFRWSPIRRRQFWRWSRD